MAKRHTTKHPGLEQPEELGRDAIVADPELTEDHEEATEVHPVSVSLTVSLMVMLQGRCARHTCVCALSFPGDGNHIMWHARRHLKCCSFKHELKHLQGNPYHESKNFWFFTGNTAPFVVHSPKECRST